MKVPGLISVVVAAIALVVSPARAEPTSSAAQPVVVELFTSQGCSSCPPADAYLTQLSKDSAILALSMHVDYWNGLGWKDPFSSATVTARQRSYARNLDAHYVYTPQMVVMGAAHAVGSKRSEVARLIAEARARMAPGPAVEIDHVTRNALTIRVGAGRMTGRATVWLVSYDTRHETKVAAGENGGRTLVYSNVVRGIRSVGNWDGSATSLTVNITEEMDDGYQNCAVLVQAGEIGPIIASASMPMRVAAR
jgi:hypothetical protein